jgi:hypothetical protein
MFIKSASQGFDGRCCRGQGSAQIRTFPRKLGALGAPQHRSSAKLTKKKHSSLGDQASFNGTVTFATMRLAEWRPLCQKKPYPPPVHDRSLLFAPHALRTVSSFLPSHTHLLDFKGGEVSSLCPLISPCLGPCLSPPSLPFPISTTAIFLAMITTSTRPTHMIRYGHGGPTRPRHICRRIWR